MTEYNCTYPRESAVAPIVIMGLLSFVTLGLLRYFLASIGSRNPNTKKLQSAAKITTIGAVVTTFYFVAVLLFFISGIIDYYNCGHAYTRGVGYGFQFTGYNLLLILFFYLFVKTFENSPYAISQKVVSLTKITLFAPFIMVFAICAVMYLKLFPLAIMSIFGVFYLLSTIGASIIILIAFVKKLNVVIQDFVKQFGTISAPQFANVLIGFTLLV